MIEARGSWQYDMQVKSSDSTLCFEKEVRHQHALMRCCSCAVPALIAFIQMQGSSFACVASARLVCTLGMSF
jgi:hypothetical protein